MRFSSSSSTEGNKLPLSWVLQKNHSFHAHTHTRTTCSSQLPPSSGPLNPTLHRSYDAGRAYYSQNQKHWSLWVHLRTTAVSTTVSINNNFPRRSYIYKGKVRFQILVPVSGTMIIFFRGVTTYSGTSLTEVSEERVAFIVRIEEWLLCEICFKRYINSEHFCELRI